MTFRSIPCSRKKDRISGASGLTVSSRRTRQSGVRAAGRPSALSDGFEERVSTRIRQPVLACSSTRLRATAHSPRGRSTSGAPRWYTPRPSNSAAAHLRADENGVTVVVDQPGSGQAAAMAVSVAFGAGSAAAIAPRASAASVPVVDPMTSMPPNEISPVVIVPVLSRQSVSTRASSSTEESSFARARRRARAMTPTMNERLVRRTRPSGTIATAAATVPRRASCQRSSVMRRRSISRPAAGGMISVSQRRMTLTPPRSSLSDILNWRASSASDAA